MTKVTFASRWVSPSGETYQGGDTAEIDPATARNLVIRGKVRYAAADTDSAETETGDSEQSSPDAAAAPAAQTPPEAAKPEADPKPEKPARTSPKGARGV
ncbi:hypothetical protein K8P10_001987 [Leucobacter sp. Psy1]|uniref:hypothetical protein n=1 Tax=Leucobacter sp. Psy1 TaxID=2875729 RepID=UPI001CD1DE05|nr:hypothetical protein [Leucobacter sp. Psy1]UBH06476.1 hypothetical protein K8P10_001987 [Leucobacter sp. Psy1]